MNFLLEEGFSEDLIQKLIKKYDESMIQVFQLEQENVVEVIHYFRKIGIKPIDVLLLSHIELFTKDVTEIKDVFSKYNLKTVVGEINKDVTTIDYL